LKKARSEILLEKYCPTIYSFTKETKTNWELLDSNFENNYLKVDEPVESNIMGILLHAEAGDEFLKAFLGYCESLASSLEQSAVERKKFRDIIVGKFTNLVDLNYLNPIGELSVLKKLIEKNYELVRIEDNETFPGAKPKDFLFKSPAGKNILIEVLNIHLKNSYQSTDELKAFLFKKIRTKVQAETKEITPTSEKNILFFQPVLWHVDLINYRKHLAFFSTFKRTSGSEIGLHFNILGFCTFGTINKKDFVFGELTTFYDNFTIE
jgi:hypothetical protein